MTAQQISLNLGFSLAHELEGVTNELVTSIDGDAHTFTAEIDLSEEVKE